MLKKYTGYSKSIYDSIKPAMLVEMSVTLSKIYSDKYSEFELEKNDEYFLYRNFLNSYFHFFAALKKSNFEYDPNDPYVYYDGYLLRSFSYNTILKQALNRKNEIIDDYIHCYVAEEISGGEYEEELIEIINASSEGVM